jgi:hypothetical protein
MLLGAEYVFEIRPEYVLIGLLSLLILAAMVYVALHRGD